MFEVLRGSFDDRPSVVEDALRRFLHRAEGRPVFVVDFEPHAVPQALTASREDAFRRLLDTGAEHLANAKAAHAEQARWAAVQARELAAFARQRPAAVLDRPDDEVGAAAAATRAGRPSALTSISEWAVDEVMVGLGLPSSAASQLLVESVTLVEQLPATLSALESGSISRLHARMLAEVLTPLKDDARAEVEAQLLSRAEGKTVAELKVAARRAVLRADAAASARRLAAAIRERQVRVFPGDDGLGSLSATFTLPVALACRNALERYAEECVTPGDERTKDQRMVDCLADLILRPGETGRPPVQAQLTVVASVGTLTGGDEPGEVDGQPVPAVVVRELAYTLGLLPRPDLPNAAPSSPEPAHPELAHADPADAQHSDIAESTGTHSTGDESTGDNCPTAEPAVPRLSANEQAAADLAGLLGQRTVTGTAPAHIPAIAVVDELSGQLLALSDAGEIRRVATCGRRSCRTGERACTHPPGGPGLGSPPESPGYRPSDRLTAFVRARDRRCRFPGCRARAIRCDLDHNQPWPAGPTSAGNLCCLCRHHHRLSHQAPGWRMRRLPDGGLEWTTPGGERITTHPLRYGTDDDLGPPGGRATAPAQRLPVLTARERVLGRPLLPGTVDDDPAPF